MDFLPPSPLRTLRLLPVLALAAAALGARAETWSRLEGDNFAIISALPEGQTRDWAVEFDLFHHGLQRVLQLDEAHLQPVTVVLFNSPRDLRPYLPLEKGKPAEMSGLFLHSPLGNFIEVSDDFEDARTRHTIFHEGVHWMNNVTDTPLPLWLDEGLAEVFSTFTTTPTDHYQYGSAVAEHVRLLREQPMMPLKQLLAIKHGSLLYNEGSRTSIFYAESWAFVHYLLFSGELEERAKYNQLVRLLRPGADPDAVFRQVFGVDCAGMDKRLANYLYHGKYSKVEIPFDRSAVNRTFRVRKATAAEVEVAECSLQVAVDRAMEAQPRLRQLARAEPGNRAVWEAEGYAAYEMKDYLETEACYRRAARLGSRDYIVYSYLGDAALGLRPGSAPPAGPGDDRRALDYYEQEIQLNPHDQHAYDNSAGSVSRIDSPTPADLALLHQGAQLYPDDNLVRVALDVVDLKQGRVSDAVDSLRRIAADPAPGNREAAAVALFILDDRKRLAAFDRLNGLWKRQDYPGVIALAEKMLGAPLSTADRQSVTSIRDQARVVMKANQGIALANAGNLPEAIRLLAEAKAESTDEQMRAQLAALIVKLNAGAGGDPP